MTDPDGGTTLAAYSFNVASINDAPELVEGLTSITLANIQEDSQLVFTEDQLLNGFSDRDGDPLSVTGLTVNTADAGSIDGDAANGYTFTANANYNGPVELIYSVTDGTDSTSATASFNVLAVNDAPELNSNSAVIDLGSVEEDLGYKGDEEDIIDQGTSALGLNPFVITEEQLLANFTDADDTIADLSVVNLIADSGTLTQTSGWEFIPSEDFVGNVNFSFSVTDGEASTPATAKLAVTNVNMISMTIGAGLTPTSPVAQKMNRLRFLASNCWIRSIPTRTGMKKIWTSPTSPLPLLVLVRLFPMEMVVTPSSCRRLQRRCFLHLHGY